MDRSPEVIAKLHRAYELQNDLKAKFEAYLAPANAFVEQNRIDTNSWELTIRILQQPTLAFGVLVGEIVHNLRSSLDIGLNLALATAYPKEYSALDYAERVNIRFPIFRHRKSYLEGKWHSGLADEALHTHLEQVQPFYGEEHLDNASEVNQLILHSPLWSLHNLWNKDKHRGISLVVAGLKTLAVGLQEDEEPIWEVIDYPPWEDGSQPFRITLLGSRNRVSLDMSTEFGIGLQEDVRPLDVFSISEKLRVISSQVEYSHWLIETWR